ncbi:MAG: sensor histidine kinase [Dehalococcoidia bacterium]
MTGIAGSDDDEERYRREALGAFAHDLRSPLTSIGMVFELGDRAAGDGAITFDAELFRMLKTSIDTIESLADGIQEVTRLERGRVALSRGPAELGAAIRAAAELLAPAVTVSGDAGATPLAGPWDAARLAQAIAEMATAVNRSGAGTGQVTLQVAPGAGTVSVTIESGTPGGRPREVASDLGFGFFRARALMLAMGAAVGCARSQGYFRVTLRLPLD